MAGTPEKKDRKTENRRVPWHVTLYAGAAWAALSGAWGLAAIAFLGGTAYLAWPRLAGKKNADVAPDREGGVDDGP